MRCVLALSFFLLLSVASTASSTDDCSDGVVKDDGVPETGYGWVPSVVEGIYVQEFRSPELSSPLFSQVCVCWLRTRNDSTIDFDVVFYEDVGGLPAEQPYAAVPAQAVDVPVGVASGGSFYDIDVTGVPVRGPTLYVGVRWNPSIEDYFFICADNGPETEPVNVFFIDDRAEEWTNALETSDPMFDEHRAIMVRTVPEQLPGVAVPGLTGLGVVALAALVAAAGFLAVGRKGQA